MAEVSWVVPTASIAAAIIVATANGIVQRWRHQVDRLGASIELFCTEINDAADLATEYWLTEPALHLRNPSAPLHGLEARLIGRQNRLQQLALALASQDGRFSIEQIENKLLPDLFEAMTGGEFQVEGRVISPERARLVQSAAAILNGELRGALGRRLQRWW